MKNDNDKTDKQIISPWQGIAEHCDFMSVESKGTKKIGLHKIHALKIQGRCIPFGITQDRKKVYTYILYRFYESNPSKFKKLSENNKSLKFCCEHFAKVQGVTYTDFKSMYDDKPSFCNLYRKHRESSNVKLLYWQPNPICKICKDLAPEFALDIQLQSVFIQK